MAFGRRGWCSPSGRPISSRQQDRQRQSLQQACGMSVETAQSSPKPVIIDPFNYAQSTLRPSNVRVTSTKVGRGRLISPSDDREVKRKIKKQNMERRRRACISGKLSALHNLAVTIVGGNPQQQQTNQRTEITDILNQCVNVLQSLSEFVKSEPELQARLHHLGLLSKRDAAEDQRRRRSEGVSSSRDGVAEGAFGIWEGEAEKENRSPLAPMSTPVGGRRAVASSTPLTGAALLSPPCCVERGSSSSTRGRKRESVDSGLSVDRSASSSCRVTETSSLPSSTPSTSFSSPLEETRSEKRSRNSSLSDIWRPYRD